MEILWMWTNHLFTTTGNDEHFHPHVYKRRWWILAVFVLSALVQSVIYNWSPLFDAALIAYSWDVSFLSLLPGLSLFGFIISVFPIMYLIETKGESTDMLN
jgi:hypothetical protein